MLKFMLMIIKTKRTHFPTGIIAFRILFPIFFKDGKVQIFQNLIMNNTEPRTKNIHPAVINLFPRFNIYHILIDKIITFNFSQEINCSFVKSIIRISLLNQTASLQVAIKLIYTTCHDTFLGIFWKHIVLNEGRNILKSQFLFLVAGFPDIPTHCDITIHKIIKNASSNQRYHCLLIRLNTVIKIFDRNIRTILNDSINQIIADISHTTKSIKNTIILSIRVESICRIIDIWQSNINTCASHLTNGCSNFTIVGGFSIFFIILCSTTISNQTSTIPINNRKSICQIHFLKSYQTICQSMRSIKAISSTQGNLTIPNIIAQFRTEIFFLRIIKELNGQFIICFWIFLSNCFTKSIRKLKIKSTHFRQLNKFHKLFLSNTQTVRAIQLFMHKFTLFRSQSILKHLFIPCFWILSESSIVFKWGFSTFFLRHKTNNRVKNR